jgi:peptidoglycan/xylan/chitin deacetylase (PgdA/CDA1 family)
MTLLVLTAAALALLYVFWRARYGAPPRDVPQVLCFHKISRRFCWEGTWTTPRRFFGYVDLLLGKDYRFIGEAEYLETIGRPDPGHRKLVFLTFDDAYSEIYTLVFPGLEERGVPFHVFLPTDYAGRENTWDLSLGRRSFRHLSWPEIGEMAARGVTFGSHGAGHLDLTRLSRQEIMRELLDSKAAIERRVGRAVRTLSYPFGRYNDEVRSLAREAAYECAFTLYPRQTNGRVDRFALRRNGVYIIDPVRLLEVKLKRNPLFWLEEMKCRAINNVAVLTPLFKRFEPGRGKRH